MSKTAIGCSGFAIENTEHRLAAIAIRSFYRMGRIGLQIGRHETEPDDQGTLLVNNLDCPENFDDRHLPASMSDPTTAPSLPRF